MGNEGSVPQDTVDDEEFENQARAPPSSSNPPLPQQPASATKETATGTHHRGGRMINAVFHRRSNNAHAVTIPTPVDPSYPTLQPEDMILMSAEQQEEYYLQKQLYHLQQQQKQQQQQQAYYNHNHLPSSPQAQYSIPSSVNPDVGGVNTTSTAYTGISNGGNNHHVPSSTSTPGPSPSKKALSFRSSGRAGAAIINSMKNLSLGNALNRGASSPSKKQQPQPQQQNVTDWETRWDEDEDDDSSEGGDENDDSRGVTIQPLHPSTTTAVNAVAANHNLTSPPPQVIENKAHLVTVTPDEAMEPSHLQYHHVAQNHHHVPVVDEDGVEWDTGAGIQQGHPSYEKPNVQMFLPLLRVLGKGSFGKVVLVQKRVGKERGQLFAMKILRKSHLVKRRQIERTRTERKVLSVVNHPFIMKLHYAFQSPDKLYLVLDYCPGGELFFHLSRFRRFPERVARFYAAELLLALGHLHKRGIIYRDLKPENVLLDADGHVKLGDFGLAKAGIQHACEGATSMCGTPEYMAPEVLAQQGHGFCVDYWGLGMLVYEMMTGLPPWYTTDRQKLFRRLRSAPLDIPTYFSQASAACVSALLERNPRRRLGVTGIRAAMEHEFFRSISWRALYGRRVEAPIRPCEGWSPPGAQSSSYNNTTTNGSYNHEVGTDLDAATANFDNTFTRMPVETDDNPDGDGQDDENLEELHEDTFVGFTFDDADRAEMDAMQKQPQSQGASSRQRTHHLETDSETRHLD